METHQAFLNWKSIKAFEKWKYTIIIILCDYY